MAPQDVKRVAPLSFKNKDGHVLKIEFGPAFNGIEEEVLERLVADLDDDGVTVAKFYASFNPVLVDSTLPEAEGIKEAMETFSLGNDASPDRLSLSFVNLKTSGLCEHPQAVGLVSKCFFELQSKGQMKMEFGIISFTEDEATGALTPHPAGPCIFSFPPEESAAYLRAKPPRDPSISLPLPILTLRLTLPSGKSFSYPSALRVEAIPAQASHFAHTPEVAMDRIRSCTVAADGLGLVVPEETSEENLLALSCLHAGNPTIPFCQAPGHSFLESEAIKRSRMGCRGPVREPAAADT